MLKPGGRFVSEMGGAMNMVGVRSIIRDVMTRRGHEVESLDPWYFPTPTRQRKVLEEAGFRVEVCGESRATAVPRGIADILLPLTLASRRPRSPLRPSASDLVRSAPLPLVPILFCPQRAPAELYPRPTPLPTGLAGWLRTFAFAFLSHLPSAEQDSMIAEVCERLKCDLWSEEEGWVVMYVRLRFKAWKD